jgi:hypothetical protein
MASREMADVVVVLVQPETGDELQWEKAGLLDIADIVVVHKADLPSSAERVESQLRELLNLPGWSRSCASVRARGSGWTNFGRPSMRARAGHGDRADGRRMQPAPVGSTGPTSSNPQTSHRAGLRH